MQYFIPAWYKNNDWKENEQAWYRARTVTEFDDTVKQIQLFFRKHVSPFKILLLGFSPNFRHFLHRQGVYHAPYLSCFDAMQGISTDAVQLFSFHDLTWPEGVEFIYSPFAVIVMLNGRKYAQIEFAEDGNMFQVDVFQNDLKVSTNYYDDRGFVSCQIVYRNGVAYREQYFNEEGTWKFARFLDDGHVVINPESRWYMLHGEKGQSDEEGHSGVTTARRVPYQKQHYRDIAEMIEEVLAAFIEKTSDEDGFIIAMHPLHSEILSHVLIGRKTVLSFFERRFGENGLTDGCRRLLQSAGYIVVDRKKTEETLRSSVPSSKTPVKVITPYDSRIETGTSQRLRVQNILVAADGIRDESFDKLVVILARYVIERNDRARIRLFTRSAQYNERVRLRRKTVGALEKAGLDPDYARMDTGKKESALDEAFTVPNIFSVAQCVDEMSVNRMLREQRVIVDLQDIPDQFLQISAMSMGIPQITVRETEYVLNGKNGTVVRTPGELVDALDYYLKDIAHYNQAQIASYDLGSHFSTGQLVDAWKEVISSIEH